MKRENIRKKVEVSHDTQVFLYVQVKIENVTKKQLEAFFP